MYTSRVSNAAFKDHRHVSIAIWWAKEVADVKRMPKYVCSCGNFERLKDCPVSGHCLEPLAWNLLPNTMVAQGECPLFTIIPKEIRDMIFEFALTNCSSNIPSLASDELYWPPLIRARHAFERTKALKHSDIAVNLLSTCQTIYLETYKLPLSLNALDFQNLNTIVQRSSLLPWQFGLIQRLYLTVRQTALEGTWFRERLGIGGNWCALARHNGAYVVPRVFRNHGRNHIVTECQESFRYALVAPGADTNIQPVLDLGSIPLRGPWECTPPHLNMRAVLASPLTHLTIHLGAEHWWTWTDAFSSLDPAEQLALDPWMGDGGNSVDSRPDVGQMRQLAQARRAGTAEEPTPTATPWGKTIGQLPDLIILELVLETFVEKKDQLDAVVECSNTWSFPIDNTPYTLLWDGKVEYGTRDNPNSKSSVHDGSWYARFARSPSFETRTVRYIRERTENVLGSTS